MDDFTGLGRTVSRSGATLRVFQALEAYASTQVRGNKSWLRNLHEPLVELGHDVVLFPLDRGREAMAKSDPDLRRRVSEELVAAILAENRRKQIDLFFCYAMEGMLEGSALDEIRAHGILTCNFSCNNTHQFHLAAALAPHFDVNLFAEKAAGVKFREIGAKALWWPMASNPKYFRPMPVETDLDLSFVGASYGTRTRAIRLLLNAGVDAHAFGPAWRYGARTAGRSWIKRELLLVKAIGAPGPTAKAQASALLAEHDERRALGKAFPQNVHDPVSDDELVRLYSRSRVSLGVLEVYEGNEPWGPLRRHLHLREFEAPMSGAVYLTGHTEELEEFFEPDREVATYRSEEELIEKAKRLVREPGEADAIRKAGRKRALADHTYHRRFGQLFEALGLGT